VANLYLNLDWLAISITCCNEVAERPHKDRHNAIGLMPLQGHVYLKYFFMHVRNLKYILSRKSLLFLTMGGEEYSTKKIKGWGKNGRVLRPNLCYLIYFFFT
jgi:hypothetical protein